MFSLLRACFGGNDTKPTPMKVCQGLKIIMLTKMDNLGALLCDGAPVMFQDSGENEMNENFLSSQTASYSEVQEAFREAQEEEDIVKIVENVEVRVPLDDAQLDPNILEYIGGWIEKKVFQKKILKMRSCQCH